MNLSDIKYKANYYALLLLVFVIPLERKFISPVIILFLLTSFTNNRIKEIKSHRILLFSALYILYAIGVLYSTNTAIGIENLVEKLSIVLFPLLIYISHIDYKNKLHSILQSFVDGCMVSIVISLIISFINFYFTLDTSNFFYNNSSSFLHPSYMAMYASFSLLIVYAILFNQQEKTGQLKLFAIILFLNVSIILSASKTGLISMLLINGVAFLYWMIKHKAFLKGGITLAIVIIGLFLSYKTSSVLKYRINELVTVASSGDTSSQSTTGARVEIWKVSTALIKESPVFGYGTGDAKSTLINTYREEGLFDFAEKKLNAHNQFLQTTIALGLVGGACLLLMLLIPFVNSLKKGYYLYASFLFLILLNFSTESMMERQAGIIFYCFFNAILFVVYFDPSSKKVLKSD